MHNHFLSRGQGSGRGRGYAAAGPQLLVAAFPSGFVKPPCTAAFRLVHDPRTANPQASKTYFAGSVITIEGMQRAPRSGFL